LIVVVVLLAANTGNVVAESPLDVDSWHAEYGQVEADEESGRFGLGLYPGVSGVLGLPNLVAYQVNVYASFSDGRSFSLFVGYGEENGPWAKSEMYTLGWGGVRRLHSGAPQNGFYGKFLRYRRWDHDDHGIHDGLSLGTETGIGYLSVAFEVGAARSDRNHWMFVAQAAVKIALPILIPLG
jgi:hypothetical protein